VEGGWYPLGTGIEWRIVTSALLDGQVLAGRGPRKHPYRDLRRNEHAQATIHCGFTKTHSPLIVAIMAWTTPIGAIAGAVIGRLRRKAPLAAAAPDQRPDPTSTFWPRVTAVDGTFVAQCRSSRGRARERHARRLASPSTRCAVSSDTARGRRPRSTGVPADRGPASATRACVAIGTLPQGTHVGPVRAGRQRPRC